ncbi:MAG: hypothetical protein K5656_09670 [Lachnospiraceae bacterium]|nr:hypothetical protein [Lachnospiraceae bacterium]
MSIDEIISDTTRKYLKDNDIVLEDWQVAWLYYHSDMDCARRNEALEEVAAKTSDTSLKEQIKHLIAFDNEMMEAFRSNQGNAIYILRESIPGDYDSTRQGCYASFELAEKMARKLSNKHSIEKVSLVSRDDDSAYDNFDEFVEDSLGKVDYNKDGGINYIYSNEVDTECYDEEEMFYERYFDFKHPFKIGDIVKFVGDDDEYICIIGVKPRRSNPNIRRDDSDSGIIVNRLERERGIMWDSDTPENPYLLDYYDIPSDSEDVAENVILEWQKILTGNGGSMQYIQDACQYLKETYDENHKNRYITGFALRDR